MTIRFPYTLQEGTVAYATKVMANLNALATVLNNLSADGFTTQDIASMISDLADAVNSKITADETGNADEVVFTDGDTLQEKFTAGDLNGTDGVTAYVDGWAAFEVDDDGHLKVSVSSAENPFSIVDGNLTFTVPDPDGGGSVVTYDLGNVQGESGEVTTTTMNSAISTAISAIGTAVACDAYVLDWSSDECIVACSGVTASNLIFVSPALSATESERGEFRDAQIYPVSQTTDSFTIGCDGTTPTADIPLQVVILNV